MFSTGSTAVDTVVSKDHRNGQNSVKITSAGGEAFLFLHQQVILEPNTDYTVSFWIKGEGLEKTGDSICLARGDNKSLVTLFTYTTEEDEFAGNLSNDGKIPIPGDGEAVSGNNWRLLPKWISKKASQNSFEKPLQCSF